MPLTEDYAKALLRRHEGLVQALTADSKGITIGYGRNVITRPLTEDQWRAMFAWGLSLVDGVARITPEYADWLLDQDIAEAVAACSRWRGWREAGPVRQAALIDAYHAMGTGLFLFERMRTALGSGDFGRAADELLDSNWGRHKLAGVRARAMEVSAILRSGSMPDWFTQEVHHSGLS